MANELLNSSVLIFLLNFWETRSLDQAAARSGISTATSFRLLSKARAVFEDPLFVKSSRKMIPTPFMQELAPKISNILSDIEKLRIKEIFDPKTLTQTFRVGCVDNAVIRFITPALRRLYGEAPNIRLSIVPLREHYREDLEKGEIDLIIYAPPDLHPDELSKKFHYFRGSGNGHVYVVRSGHPLVQKLKNGGALCREDLKPYRIAAVKYGYSESSVTTATAGFEEGEEIAFDSPYFMTLPFVLMNTDFIGRLPTISAEWIIRGMPLTILPKNLVREQVWRPIFLWHERTHYDPAFQWFRSVLIESASVKEESLQGSH